MNAGVSQDNELSMQGDRDRATAALGVADMAQTARKECAFSTALELRQRQMRSGGWAYSGSSQESIEATCMSLLGLSPERESGSASAVEFLFNSQLANGAWPAFRGDTEGSWTTPLALSTMIVTNHTSEACQRALKWLVAEKGEEGHWLWRWKFKTVDRNVRFDPDKYGWPWSPFIPANR
jgi:hypothetical protein